MSLTGHYQGKPNLDYEMISAWTSKTNDPDDEVARWVKEGTPLGINKQIRTRGVFPPSDKNQDVETPNDAAMQMSRGVITNYARSRN